MFSTIVKSAAYSTVVADHAADYSNSANVDMEVGYLQARVRQRPILRLALFLVISLIGTSCYHAFAAKPSRRSVKFTGAPAATYYEQSEGVIVQTVETRKTESSFPMRGVPGATEHNLGAHKKWEGFRSKVDAYLPWIRDQAFRNPSKLEVFSDGLDMVFGGCSPDELKHHYMLAVAANGGAPVLVSADTEIWPKQHWEQSRFDSINYNKQQAMHAFGFETDEYKPFLNWGSYTYPNSGFIMGPAGALKDTLECMRTVHWGPKYDDQLALTECMFRNPGSISPDFSGSVVLSMKGVNYSVFKRKPGYILNRVTRQKQCFAHMNWPDPFPEDEVLALVDNPVTYDEEREPARQIHEDAGEDDGGEDARNSSSDVPWEISAFAHTDKGGKDRLEASTSRPATPLTTKAPVAASTQKGPPTLRDEVVSHHVGSGHAADPFTASSATWSSDSSVEGGPSNNADVSGSTFPPNGLSNPPKDPTQDYKYYGLDPNHPIG